MIYLDHAATTPMDKSVVKAMEPFYTENFGNPSSMYKIGRIAARAMSEARTKIADILNCDPSEIIFTAGGTESDNLAIFGIAKNLEASAKDYHFITSKIEHSAVLEVFRELEKKGFEVTYLPVDKFGLIDSDVLMRSLKPNTVMVSIMYANNEIGTIQNLAEISKILKNYSHIQRIDTVSAEPIFPLLHTDACQAAGYLDLDVKKLGVDLMTLNGSKVYGPKQVGILYKKKEVKLSPMLVGGGQEAYLRPGTENVAGIVGLAKALEIVNKDREKESKKLESLRDWFIMEILKIDGAILNGHPTKRLPNNVNVSFPGAEGESILLKLDAEGIYVSTGSACHSMNIEPSHVMLALDPNNFERAHGSIRFSMGKSTNKRDIEKVLKILPSIIEELKKMSAIKYEKK